MVDLDIPQPVATEIYYATCSKIVQNNQIRCNDLKLEKKLGTHSWGRRVNLSIFSVSVVDTYNVATQSLAYEETSHVLFCALAEEMTDNNLDSRPTRPPSKRTGRSASPVPVRKRAAAHLFKICKKIRLQNGRCTTYHKQGRHRICQVNTTWMCSLCHMEDLDDEHWHCNAKSGRYCFQQHVDDTH